MRRVLPWALVIVAVGITLVLALPLLLDDAGNGGPGDELVPRETTPGVAAPSLVGAPGARPAGSGTGAGPLRILGDVMDRDGRPLTGVAVVACRTPWEPDARGRVQRTIQALASPQPPPVVAETRTGAEGEFELSVSGLGRYRVEAVVEPPRRSSTPYAHFRAGRSGEERVSVQVREGTTLTGRVLGANDEGVACALSAMSYRAGGWMAILDAVETEPASGRFSLPALTAGRWRVTLTLPGGVRIRGYEVEVPHEGDWTIRLGDETGALRGEVTVGEATSVAGAQILVSTSNANRSTHATGHATTAADGTYRMDCVPVGEVTRVQIVHADYVAYEGTPPLADWAGLAVAGGEVAVLDVTLEAGAAISGRVFDVATDAPLEGVEVFIAGPSVPNADLPSGRTDASGRYRISGIGTGRHVLLARCAGYYLPDIEKPRRRAVRRGRYDPSSTELVPPALALAIQREDREIERDLGMRRGITVLGRVLGPDEAPVAGAYVSAVGLSLSGVAHRLGVRAPPSGGEEATSAADGTFRLEGLPPRTDWVFFARKEGLVSVPTGEIALLAEAPPEALTLRLEVGAVLAGTVLGPDGKGRVAQILAYLTGPYQPGHAFPRTEAKSDGSFTLEGVSAGGCRLSAWTQDEGTASLEVKGLAVGERREGLRLELPAGVRVAGVVVDPDGKAVSNLLLTVAKKSGQSSMNTRTDDKGRFVFANAPEGTVRFQAHRFRDGLGRPEQIGDAIESPAEDVRLVLTEEVRALIEGEVRGPDGRPIPICRVVLASGGSDRPYYGGSPSTARREEIVGGHFRREVNGPPPYEIRVSEARDAQGRLLNLQPAKMALPQATATPVQIRLKEGIVVEGRVVGSDGEGIPDVHLGNEAGDAWTDAAGRFALAGFRGPEDRILVEVPEGYVSHSPVTIGAARAELVIEIQRGLSIAGVVLDPEGKPQPRAGVSATWQITGGTSGRTSGQSDVAGRFEIEGIPPDARVTLTARLWSGGVRAAPAIEEDVPAGTMDVVLQLGAGVTIEGVVVDTRGEPVTKGYVRAYSEGSSSAFVPVGEDGTFTLSGLAAGTHRISFMSTSGGPAPEDLTVQAPDVGVRIVLPPVQTISGRVVGDVPVEGYGVTARPTGTGGYSSRPRAVVAADGTFTLENVGGISYHLQIGKTGSEYYGRADAVAPDTQDLVVRLQQGLSIEGTLDNAAGNPLAKGWVYVDSDVGWYQYAPVTDGAFRIPALPPGRYRLRMSVPGQEPVLLGEADAGDHGLRLQARER